MMGTFEGASFDPSWVCLLATSLVPHLQQRVMAPRLILVPAESHGPHLLLGQGLHQCDVRGGWVAGQNELLMWSCNNTALQHLPLRSEHSHCSSSLNERAERPCQHTGTEEQAWGNENAGQHRCTLVEVGREHTGWYQSRAQ